MAARYDCSVRQGETWRLSAQVLLQGSGAALDLLGYTGAMQVRKSAAGDLLATATVTVDNVTRTVVAEIASTATDDLEPGVWEYDLFLTLPSGDKLPLLYGSFVVEAGVTR